MLPYFQYNAITLGPIVLQVWGLWVAGGVLAGIFLSERLAKKYFLNPLIIWDLGLWGLAGGLLGARLAHILFYDLSYYLVHPEEIIKFWHGGASSLGGFLGATIAIAIFARWRKFSWRELLPYFDVGVVGLWLGWGIGRIGCFFIHDHLGRLSNFFLAVNFPDGARHDLGLYDSLLGFALFAICYLLFVRLIKIRWGLVTGLSFASYAFVRFWLDFLRAADIALPDARYGYLTPAQWGMGAVFFGLTILGIYSKFKRLKK